VRLERFRIKEADGRIEVEKRMEVERSGAVRRALNCVDQGTNAIIKCTEK
jgi:hypothetical protein